MSEPEKESAPVAECRQGVTFAAYLARYAGITEAEYDQHVRDERRRRGLVPHG